MLSSGQAFSNSYFEWPLATYHGWFFLFLSKLNIPPTLTMVLDLMQADDLSWNASLIRKVFPISISNKIIQTPIIDIEEDREIWCPFMARNFTIKSAYNMILKDEIEHHTSHKLGGLWKIIWNASLHMRHKLLLYMVIY